MAGARCERRSGPPPQVQLWLALAFDANGQRPEALELYKKLEGTHPMSVRPSLWGRLTDNPELTSTAALLYTTVRLPPAMARCYDGPPSWFAAELGGLQPARKHFSPS